MKQEITQKTNTFHSIINNKVIKVLLDYWESRNFEISKNSDESYTGNRYPRVGSRSIFNLPAKIDLSISSDCVKTNYGIYTNNVWNPIVDYSCFDKEIEKANYLVELMLLEDDSLEIEKIEDYSKRMKKHLNFSLLITAATLIILDLVALFISLFGKRPDGWADVSEIFMISGSVFGIEFIIFQIIKKLNPKRLVNRYLKMLIQIINQVVKPISKLKNRKKKEIK